MAKIPFTLEAWLKDKSQRVETRDGRIVHNIWPVKEPLIFNGKKAEVCALIDGEEDALVFFEGGKYIPVNPESPFDLFLVTPKEELTPFEKKLIQFSDERNSMECDNLPEDREGEILADHLHRKAAELLDLAREHFIKDSYFIEKKAFHDVVENISDKHLAEMSVQYSLHCKIEDGTRHAIMNWSEFQKVAQKFIDIGKAEAVEKYKQSWFNEGKIAGRFEGLTEDEKYQQGVHDGKEEVLKDLPGWKPAARAYDGDRLPRIDWSLNRLVARFEEGIFYLDIRELYKLPGFKEEL